jgi:hypothetical protein
MRDTTSTSAYRNWSWHIAFLLAGLLAAYLVGHVLRTREASIRTAGGVLQVLGILSVALGISQLRRSFGLKGTVAEVIAELLHLAKTAVERVAQLFGRRPAAISVVGGDALAFASARARVKVRSGPNASVDDRITLLEGLIDALENALSTLQDTIDRDREQLNKTLDAERHAREEGFKALEDRITSLAVGGIRLQTVGLVWLFLGVLLATWSQELASIRWP